MLNHYIYNGSTQFLAFFIKFFICYLIFLLLKELIPINILKKRSVAITLSIVIVASLLVTAIYDFKVTLDKSLELSTYEYLDEISEMNAKSFQKSLDVFYGFLGSMAAYVGTLDDIQGERGLKSITDGMADHDIVRIAIADVTGDVITTDSKTYNVANEPYFKSALNSKRSIANPVMSPVDNKYIINLSVPIFNTLEPNTVKGVMTASIDENALENFFSPSMFSGKGYSYIVETDGTIVTTEDKMKVLSVGMNLFDSIGQLKLLQGETSSNIIQQIHNGKTGRMKYSNNRSDKVVKYMPIGVNDWYIVSVLPYQFMSIQSNHITQSAVFLMLKILFIFSLMIAAIIYDYRKNAAKFATMQCAVDKSNTELKFILSSITAGILRISLDEQLSVVDLNDSGYELLGYTKEQFEIKLHNSFLGAVYGEDKQLVTDYIIKLKETNKLDGYQHRIIRGDGATSVIAGTGTIAFDGNGEKIAVITFVDVTKQSEIAERLLYSEKRYQIAISNTNMAVFDYYRDKKQLVQPAVIAEPFGLNLTMDNMPESIIEAGCIAPESIDIYRELYVKINSGAHYASAVVHLINKNQRDSYCEIALSNILDGTKVTNIAIGIMKDITDSKMQEFDLRRKSECDLLTGLYNKTATQNRIEDIIATGHSTDLHALFIIDIDNFKGINDNLGHVFGDAVLTEIASQLKNNFRSTDIVGRVGGDEFMTFLCNIKSETAVHEKAKEICNDLRKSFTATQNTHSISASVGIAIFGRHGITYDQLYYNADIALYTAKRNGKDGYAIFDGCSINSLEGAAPRDDNRVAFDGQRTHNFSIDSDIRSYIFEILYKAKDIQSSISLILEMVGVRFDASRVYIFENTNDGLYTTNTFEWCNKGIEPEIQDLNRVKISALGGFFEEYSDQGLFYCNDVRTLEPALSEFLAVQGIKSILHIAIEQNGVIRGFVGFDDCNNYRMWSDDEVRILSFIGKIIGSYILKKQVEDELVSINRNKKAILDGVDSFIYVIDFDTYDLLYINKKTMDLVPNVKLGEKCYTAFWNGRTEPCEFCPVQGLSPANGQCTMDICNNTLNIWTKTTASRVDWTGLNNTALLCCTDITEYKIDK